MDLTTGIVVTAGAAWLAVLFGVAVFGERRPGVLERRWALVYALSLAIHCTSWTFYGTVTQASRSGWWLPPTFVGAIILYTCGVALMVRLVAVAREYNAGSLSDLIAARLGRHSGLAALATGVMVLAIVPYIALQLKAVAMSYGILVRGQAPDAPAWQDSALYVALVMALFAMLFGTRRASTVEHNRGLILAIAFESVFKLVAMLAIGAVVLWTARGTALPAPAVTADGSAGFPALIVLGALAMFAMPHQFHAAVVECRDRADIRTARWLFPLYLLLIALPILPLARLGDALLGPSGVPSDLYMLALPLSQRHEAVALLGFLGGLSAATSMVVVATLALSLMVANHFVAPILVRQGWGGTEARDLRHSVLLQRRAAILVIVVLAWAYSRAVVGSDALADIGAISFSALAGLAPATWAALYRPQLGARAVGAGLVAGTLAWVYVLWPVLTATTAAWLDTGPFGLHWLAPRGLLGLDEWSALGRAVTLNLALNVTVMLAVARSRWGQAPAAPGGAVQRDQLQAMAQRFLPRERVTALFAAPGTAPALQARVEHELAAVIGASSARLLLNVVRDRQHGELEQVAAIVGAASRDLRFNQRVMEAALENMTQGISVVDAELRVVAWNRRYEQLFAYPPGLLTLGQSIAVLTRYNLERGVIGPGDIEARLARRLAAMRAGTPHLSERRFPDGTIIEIRGNPMPGGGFVATFTDVTAFRDAERELTRANETLEQRVDERTAALARATSAAERANRAKSRFLAAVSHDLAQPLNAAHLFTHALDQQLKHVEYREAVTRIDGALGSAEDLLASVLAISRLDSGGLKPKREAFRLEPWMNALASEFGVVAAERGLTLRCRTLPVEVWSDPHLLRRVLQNFLANAVRYTRAGGVLLAARRRGDTIALEVWDTGPGIAPADQDVIFEEFQRIDRATPGLGLGLAIAERTARLLGHPLTLRSRLGRGTVFAVRVPVAKVDAERVEVTPAAPSPAPSLRILVLDDDADVRAAMRALLAGWGCTVATAADIDTALVAARTLDPDVLLLDYHLAGDADGLAAWQRLRAAVGERPGAIISADRSATLRAACAEAGCHLLYKPLKPLALKSLLAHLQPSRDRLDR